MSFETNKFTVVKKKRLEKSQFNVECVVATDCEIDKILSVCHNAQAETAEILNGVVNFTGVIDVCVLYCTVDGEIGTLNSSCPFTSKMEDSMIAVGDKVAIKVDVIDCQIDAVQNGNIKLSCTVEQSGVLIMAREVPYCKAGDDSVCIREDEMPVNVLLGQTSEVFNVESEVSIKEPVKKVLLSDSQVTIKTTECGVNFISVGGEVVTRVLYLTEKDRFESCYITESFKEELELEGVTRDSICEAVATVKKSAVKCEIEEVEKGINIKLTTPILVTATVTCQQDEMVMSDVYSTKNELEISTESFEMSKQYACDYFEAKIDGNLTLDEDRPRVDKIMFVGGANLVVTNAYLKGGEVFVEGVTKTNVIYLNDETNSLNSVVVEVPFVVSDKASVDCEDAEVSANALLCDVDVVVKKGREFYFDAKLKVNACYDCQVTGAVISHIEERAEIAERDCAMELVFAGAGQTAWDIANSLKIREDTITMQNPNIVFPLESDENIVVFYQKKN
ncbi:MAG: DUF3794 domain-containing protein [Candidatus Caccovivens sp.]